MTREQATELVGDLIHAYCDHEHDTLDKYYRDQFRELKRRVIDALTDGPEAVA